MLNLLQEKGFLEHKATGSSMMPFIKSGDVLIIKSFTEKLTVGDVALFEKDGKLVLHRVYKVYYNGYNFRGDNRYKADGFVPREKVFGKLDAVYKKNKVIEFNNKQKKLAKIYNFVLFRFVNIFCMRLISKIKNLFKKRK